MPFELDGRSCAEVVDACLARAAQVEERIHAFAWLDAERARRLAHEIDRRGLEGGYAGWTGNGDAAGRPLLWGVPAGIKDVIDTAGVPTECGSALFAGRVPDTSAEVTRRLEAAGALVLGKTVTAECAFLHPGPTRNPWDTTRTSGGSSMGSAAAVAAGIVPAAVGTQTNGSVIRPAAFCGVVGFKPSAGRVPRDGVLQFSGTLDQIGGFTRSVADAARLVAAMAGEPLDRWWDGGTDARREPAGRLQLAVIRTAEWPHAGDAMRARFQADVKTLAQAGAELHDPPLPAGMEECVTVHHTIMQYEAAQSLGALVAAQPDKVSEALRSYVEAGARIPQTDYVAALRERERLIAAFTNWATPYDAILTPPAAGEAPGPETTGDPRFCTRWTLVGAPALTLPTGLGPYGLPLGLQLVGAPDADRRLLVAAAWVERVLPAPVWTMARLGR